MDTLCVNVCYTSVTPDKKKKNLDINSIFTQIVWANINYCARYTKLALMPIIYQTGARHVGYTYIYCMSCAVLHFYNQQRKHSQVYSWKPHEAQGLSTNIWRKLTGTCSRYLRRKAKVLTLLFSLKWFKFSPENKNKLFAHELLSFRNGSFKLWVLQSGHLFLTYVNTVHNKTLYGAIQEKATCVKPNFRTFNKHVKFKMFRVVWKFKNVHV